MLLFKARWLPLQNDDLGTYLRQQFGSRGAPSEVIVDSDQDVAGCSAPFGDVLVFCRSSPGDLSPKTRNF